MQFVSNSKSGQFFFFTRDGAYMVKTISQHECKELRRILPQYYAFLKSNPHSFIVRILGCHRVQMYHINRTVYFIVMTSAYRGAMRSIDVQYDCKGSKVGRNAKPGDAVRKDNDLISDGFKLKLGKNRVREGSFHQTGCC